MEKKEAAIFAANSEQLSFYKADYSHLYAYFFLKLSEDFQFGFRNYSEKLRALNVC